MRWAQTVAEFDHRENPRSASAPSRSAGASRRRRAPRSPRSKARRRRWTRCSASIAPRSSPRSRRDKRPRRRPSRGSTRRDASTGSRITPGVRRRISSAEANRSGRTGVPTTRHDRPEPTLQQKGMTMSGAKTADAEIGLDAVARHAGGGGREAAWRRSRARPRRRGGRGAAQDLRAEPPAAGQEEGTADAVPRPVQQHPHLCPARRPASSS